MEMNLVEFRKRMADPLNQVIYGGERIVLQRHGNPVAAVVSMQDLQTLRDLEDAADLKAALKARKERGGVTLEQYRKSRGE